MYMTDDTVHENDNYTVFIDRLQKVTQGGIEFLGAYVVMNKHSGVREYISTAMPEALFASEQLNHAILTKGWEWRNNKAEQSPLNADLLS